MVHNCFFNQLEMIFINRFAVQTTENRLGKQLKLNMLSIVCNNNIHVIDGFNYDSNLNLLK